MRITKLHHACVTITDGTSVLLFDPGEFAPGSVDGVDVVCVTHLHRDHLDPAIITAALARGIPVWLPRDAADLLEPTRSCALRNRAANSPSVRCGCGCVGTGMPRFTPRSSGR